MAQVWVFDFDPISGLDRHQDRDLLLSYLLSPSTATNVLASQLAIAKWRECRNAVRSLMSRRSLFANLLKELKN